MLAVPRQKRKRAESSEDGRGGGLDSSENEEPPEEDDEEGSDEDETEYLGTRPQPRKKVTAAKSNVATSASNGPTRKKPRVAEKPRRRKPSALDTVAAMKDASISDDNTLFSKLLTRSAAIMLI